MIIKFAHLTVNATSDDVLNRYISVAEFKLNQSMLQQSNQEAKRDLLQKYLPYHDLTLYGSDSIPFQVEHINYGYDVDTDRTLAKLKGGKIEVYSGFQLEDESDLLTLGFKKSENGDLTFKGFLNPEPVSVFFTPVKKSEKPVYLDQNGAVAIALVSSKLEADVAKLSKAGINFVTPIFDVTIGGLTLNIIFAQLKGGLFIEIYQVVSDDTKDN